MKLNRAFTSESSIESKMLRVDPVCGTSSRVNALPQNYNILSLWAVQGCQLMVPIAVCGQDN